MGFSRFLLVARLDGAVESDVALLLAIEASALVAQLHAISIGEAAVAWVSAMVAAKAAVVAACTRAVILNGTKLHGTGVGGAAVLGISSSATRIWW